MRPGAREPRVYTFEVNLILSGRGVELDESLRQYAAEKLTRVERFFDRIIKMEVELRHERNPRVKDPNRVEVVVKTPRQTLRVHGEGLDHYAAIDVAADRLEAQVKRMKERLTDHHNHHNHHANSHRVPVATDIDDDAEDGPAIVRVSAPVDKPLTPEEARLELEDRGMQFLVFTDAETMLPSVLYRRPGGDYGLVQAEN
jgi:ribosomal subunit interface protein